MVEVVILDDSSVDGLAKSDAKDHRKSVKKSNKRKRSMVDESLSAQERESLVAGFQWELDGLYAYFKDVMREKVLLDLSSCHSSNSLVSFLLEESPLPFSKLVDGIYEKMRSHEGTTLASVRSCVLSVGQRSAYGVAKADANVLEDDCESCLWCWETRDMKLLPKNQRGILNIRRICRKKIHERISSVSAMLSALSMSETHQDYKTVLMKASEKIGKTLTEADICSLVQNLLEKNNAEMAEKETKMKEKKLIKDMKRTEQEIEKEKKRKDRELQREKLQSEKEQKRMRDEAEKEERRREKGEAEIRKQLKRQQEEAEKDQRRREKEEAEVKKQLAIKKQASVMERFLKSNKSNSIDHHNQLSLKASDSDSFGNSEKFNAMTLAIDNTLSRRDVACVNDLLKSHLAVWHKLSQSLHSQRSHWGIRCKPKISIVTELKLQGSSCEVDTSGRVTTPNRGPTSSKLNNHRDPSLEKLVDGWEEGIIEDKTCHNDVNKACRKTRKLLQFDQSHRPAYYGTLSKKSGVIGPRHPLKKDPNLDYDVESDEEWEEEEPGESLSDCDKDDDEENLEDGNRNDEDEDESEDSFMVPDGYLSENEGVHVDSMDSDTGETGEADDGAGMPICKQEIESDEFRALLRQQKYLHNLTENALRRNQPLIISNLMHEKNSLLCAGDLTGTSKIEQICLQALTICPCSEGEIIVNISEEAEMLNQEKETCSSQSKSEPRPVLTGAILDSDMPAVVSCIKLCSYSINKAVESLHSKFPAVSKFQLRNKVREIADFVDNHWQVKKEILDRHGLSISPVKRPLKTKGIATFFSKRCLPPSGESINVPESPPQPCQKTGIGHAGIRRMESQPET